MLYTKSRPLFRFQSQMFWNKGVSQHFHYFFLLMVPFPISVIVSLCIHYFWHTPFQFRWRKKHSFSCKDGNFRALVTGHYRSFSVQAPFIWINLPADIRHCSSLSQFRFFSWKLSPYFCLLWATLTNLHWKHRWNKNGLPEFYAWLLAMPRLFVSAL